MEAKLLNGLKPCPIGCKQAKISTEAIEVQSFNGIKCQIVVMLTCDHMEVCKLRREDA